MGRKQGGAADDCDLDDRAAGDDAAGDDAAGDHARRTLAQIGWFDQRRRVLTLRLSDAQWRTVQRAVLRAAAETPVSRSSLRSSTEQLLVDCLRQWLEARDAGAADSNTSPPRGAKQARFAPRGDAALAQTLAELDAWLARFTDQTLFTVTMRRGLRSGATQEVVDRDELHRQKSAQGVRRMVQRHGARVRTVEAESISAADWTDAVDRFGTCE
ncbi:MAG: hypothetical protein RIC55_28300 [Pirellulaceae bacterium]